MRQAIRVYASVALVAMVALVAGLWMNPASIVGGQSWGAMALSYVVGLQLWVLLVIPLGVLAASEAARTGHRGWLALFIALIVLAPLAAWIHQLANDIHLLIIGPCLPDAVCPSSPLGMPPLVTQVGWVLAFLPIPLAALIYSLPSARSAAEPATAEAGQGERRALIVSAIIGIVVVSALGCLGTTPFLLLQFGRGSFAQSAAAFNVQTTLLSISFKLAALPVAIASLALAHAVQTGRRGWLAGWIALAALALLTVDLGTLWGWIAIGATIGAHSGEQIPFFEQLRTVSFVAPAVIMLVALLYALTVMRPRPHAAATLAAA